MRYRYSKLCIILISLVNILLGSAFALSCAYPIPTFDDMLEDAEVVIRGTVVAHTIQDSFRTMDDNYCSMENVAVGVHEFVVRVEDVIRGGVTIEEVVLTRSVTGMHCTWGGSCVDMQIGTSYVILADEDGKIRDGLCVEQCPYMESTTYDKIYNPQPSEPIMCTMQYDPVCGKDGKTYGNACMAGDTPIAYEGECVCMTTKEYEPVCGVDGETYSNYSAAKCENVAVAYQGVCKDEPSVCTQEYDPVCGIDGKTYSNRCMAGNMPIDHEGPCMSIGGNATQKVPQGCVSWYDGCNTCMVGENNSLSCTRMACVEHDRPYCQAYNYTVLTVTQEKLIEELVPQMVSDIGLQELRRKVQIMRTKVQDTLARSMFVKGDPALRKYTLLLELTQKIETILDTSY